MRKSYLSLEQRIHNAEGAQAAETLHARHAFLHAKSFGDEEWGQVWSHSDDTSWAHSFGRMRGYDSVYYNNVTTYNCGGQRGYQQMLNILPEIGHFDARACRELAMHTLATDIVEVADDGGTARASFLTPGVLFSTLNANLKCRCMTLWERYGSDFIFEDGEWKYLHEQVCPDLGGSFDDGNQAHSKYEQLVNPQAGPGGPPPGGAAAKPTLDPPESGTGLWLQDGGPLHTDYTPVQLVQNSVPFPLPYKTMDDDNTYTKKAQLKVSLNIERFGKIVGAVDIPMQMGGPGGGPGGPGGAPKGGAPGGEKPAGGPGGAPGGAPGGPGGAPKGAAPGGPGGPGGSGGAPGGPGGPPQANDHWNATYLRNAVIYASGKVKKGAMHVITGVGNEAVIGAMACVAYPEQAMYSIPAIGKDFPVYYLPMGKDNPKGDIKFSVRTEGDHTYIEYQADDPTKPAVNGPHNYDIEKLPLETIPEVPADSHVYITGNGQFPLKASLAYSYCDRCKSINMRPQGDELFTCIASFCSERKVGDQTK